MADEVYLNTAEVAARVKAAPETVRYWRNVGVGPRSFRLPGTRRVLYAKSDVEAWIAEAVTGDAA